MEDVVESPDPASTSSFSPLECTYSITVYAGYGVEIQVMCIMSKHFQFTVSQFQSNKQYIVGVCMLNVERVNHL